MNKRIILIIAVFLMVTGFVFQKTAFPESRADQVQQNRQSSALVSNHGVIKSISIEPSRKDGGWLLYKDGAKVIMLGENLRSAEIRYFPAGTGMGGEFPKGKVLGSMSSAGGTTWEFVLQKFLLATNFWVEAVDVEGRMIKGPDLGNVGYEEAAWYYDGRDQKKPGTPDDWVHDFEGTRSACWHKPGVQCGQEKLEEGPHRNSTPARKCAENGRMCGGIASMRSLKEARGR